MTLSANHSSSILLTNACIRHSTVMRFETLIHILGIARDPGRLSASHAASFVPVIGWEGALPK